MNLNTTSSKMLKILTTRQLSNISKQSYADVVISGGGMVGTAMACALGKQPSFKDRRIVLLETAKKSNAKDWNNCPYENRVSAITPGSKRFLSDIGVWDKIDKRRLNSFTSMQVWEGYGKGSISFNASDIGGSDIAHIVENSVIVESCTEQVQMCDQVDMKYESKLTYVDLPETRVSEGLVTVGINNEEEIKTKLLIGADGFNSFIRSSSGITTLDYDYNQSAVVATLKIKTNTLNKTAWQRFLTTGPIALLPLSDEWSSLVWSTSKQQAKELMQLSESEFVEKVNEAFTKQRNGAEPFSHLVKNIVSVFQPGKYAGHSIQQVPCIVDILLGSRGMFPLGLKHSSYYVKSRVALIGDSAHRIHPMAGQGVNLGFGDAKCLVDTIDKSCEYGSDFGSLENLLPYETERQRHVLSIIGAINGLNTLFSTEAFPVALARTIGLTLTDSIPFIKQQIIQHAMR